MSFYLSPFAPENVVSRDRFGRAVPRQPAHSPHLLRAGLSSTESRSPLFIVFAQNLEGIIVTSQTREQGMMECAVSSSLFSVYAIKKRVH